MSTPDQIAVLIPCLNEAATIGKVIGDFRRAAPGARIVIIDNGSTDRTTEIARGAGADVIHEARRGKGRALRSAFERVSAGIYILADGDDQMPADRLPALIEPIQAGTADLVIGSRALGRDADSHRLNRIGNRGFTWLLRSILRADLTDVLSGYRAISRAGLERLHLGASSFEIEVELTIKACQARLRVAEVPIAVRARPTGTRPRIRVLRDGARILAAIAVLLLHGRPGRFFVPLGVSLLVLASVPAAFAAAAGGTLAIVAGLLSGAVALAGAASIAAAITLQPVARRLQPDVALGAGMASQGWR